MGVSISHGQNRRGASSVSIQGKDSVIPLSSIDHLFNNGCSSGSAGSDQKAAIFRGSSRCWARIVSYWVANQVYRRARMRKAPMLITRGTCATRVWSNWIRKLEVRLETFKFITL